MCKVLIFGPPGIGKSSLIRVLKRRRNVTAIDLEEFAPNRVARYATVWQWWRYQHDDTAVFGAADLDPLSGYPKGTITVLLTASQNFYDRRRAKRDARHPEKAGQRHHLIDEWEWYPFSIKFDVSRLTMTEIATAIETLIAMRREKEKSTHV